MNTHRGVAPGRTLKTRAILGDGTKPGQALVAREDLATEQEGVKYLP